MACPSDLYAKQIAAVCSDINRIPTGTSNAFFKASDGQLVPVHWNFLASQSSDFKYMFEHGGIQNNIISLDVNYEVANAFAIFIHERKHADNFNENLALELLKLGHRYQVRDLPYSMTHYILSLDDEEMNVETALKTNLFASFPGVMNANELKEKTTRVLELKFDELKNSVTCKKIIEENMPAANVLLEEVRVNVLHMRSREEAIIKIKLPNVLSLESRGLVESYPVYMRHYPWTLQVEKAKPDCNGVSHVAASITCNFESTPIAEWNCVCSFTIKLMPNGKQTENLTKRSKDAKFCSKGGKATIKIDNYIDWPTLVKAENDMQEKGYFVIKAELKSQKPRQSKH